MFGLYERSLKALSGFYNLVVMVTFPWQLLVQKGKENLKMAILSLLFKSK